MLLFYQSAGTDGAQLSVLHSLVLVLVVLPLPEALLAIARGVIVGRAGTVTLLSLMSTAQEDLKGC